MDLDNRSFKLRQINQFRKTYDEYTKMIMEDMEKKKSDEWINKFPEEMRKKEYSDL